MGYYKPAQIHSKFVPGLGISGKMSSSKPDTALFTTDSPEVIDKKILSAFTGGQATVELQRKLGEILTFAQFSGTCAIFSIQKENRMRDS